MRKKIAICIMCGLLTLSFTGCGNTVTPTVGVSDATYNINAEDDMFLRIPSIDGWIYVDNETKCQYMFVKHMNAGGLILLVNSDGTPKLYEENNCSEGN